MARPSKLTDAQWEKIGKRLLLGESASSLAREFGISKASVSARFSERVQNVKTVANQIVETDRAISLLNVSEQIAAHDLAAQLKSISGHLASAANYGAATAHRLSGIAHAKVAMIDDAAPLDENSVEELKGISVLTRMANAASEIGVNLLRANKEKIDEMNKGESPEDMNWTINLVSANGS
jgi:hypothetical protein